MFSIIICSWYCERVRASIDKMLKNLLMRWSRVLLGKPMKWWDLDSSFSLFMRDLDRAVVKEWFMSETSSKRTFCLIALFISRFLESFYIKKKGGTPAHSWSDILFLWTVYKESSFTQCFNVCFKFWNAFLYYFWILFHSKSWCQWFTTSPLCRFLFWE